jgi:hypothetical protein
MSRTYILSIWPGEKYALARELRNSWGSAPLVWNAMSQKYLGTKPYEYMLGNQIEKLLPLWKDKSIPISFRAVLTLTYDRMYVLRKDYPRMVADISAFLNSFTIPSMAANHWPEIGNYLDSNPDCPAVALWCTSVSECGFEGPWNEEKQCHDPFDWATASDLYAELAAEEATHA